MNTNYLILFNNRREITLLDRQMFPDNTKYFIEAFNDAVSTLYVLIQNKAKTPDCVRLATNLLSDHLLLKKEERKKERGERMETGTVGFDIQIITLCEEDYYS